MPRTLSLGGSRGPGFGGSGWKVSSMDQAHGLPDWTSTGLGLRVWDIGGRGLRTFSGFLGPSSGL